jgi:PAS domain S-box-containing protein
VITSSRFDDIFAVMSAASVGDMAARVTIEESPQAADTATRFAIALNVLLDDLTVSAATAEHELAERARLTRRLQTLADASREFSMATDDLDHLLDAVARRLGEAFGDFCTIRLVTEDGEWLESKGVGYHSDPKLCAAMREVMGGGTVHRRVGVGVSGRVAANGIPLRIPVVDTVEFLSSSEPKDRPFLEGLGITSAMTIPLVCRGRVVGVANLLRCRSDHPYSEDDLRFVQNVAEHGALAIGNAMLYAAERAARDAAEVATSASRAAQARFARLSESGIIGIIINDLGGRVFEINDALLAMVGYSREEILSGEVAWSDLTPLEWLGVDTRAREQLASSGIGRLREKEYLRKDGKRVAVLAGSAMLDEGSERCVSFVLDLTERREAQAAIERLREERAVDARIAAIVDSSDDAIIGKSLDGVVITWNQGAQRLFGYAADEIVGKSLSLLIPPDRMDEEPAILDAVSKGEVKRLDTVRRRKDGSEVDVSLSISPVRDAAGRIVGLSKVARDITERRRAELALAGAKDAAEAANRELEAFSYSVAHDLRAPLRGMNGFAQVLLDNYKDKLDSEGQDWLAEIVLNAKKMGELIDGLLALARVTRSELRAERVDLSAIVREVASRLRALSPDRAVEVDVEEDIWAHVDARLARALVENLLDNAWKFTQNEPRPRIEFGRTQKDGALACFVRDNGAGFNMAYARKLFAPFQRLHSVSEFPGTGIGLATVQRIVHRHEGRVWAEGIVDGGATFYFTLPVGGSPSQ